MNQRQERHAARMLLDHAAANLQSINRLPKTTPEQIRRQSESRAALYERVYQARTTLARLKPARKKRQRTRKPPAPRPPRPVDPRQTSIEEACTAGNVEASSRKPAGGSAGNVEARKPPQFQQAAYPKGAA